mmetsp:Transcript_18642/g.70508  ORF Transcript_18642/g.70508 Transcript_18642/m.70508 type:complete len:170 (+) Transcript_18642:759-1268(+)
MTPNFGPSWFATRYAGMPRAKNERRNITGNCFTLIRLPRVQHGVHILLAGEVRVDKVEEEVGGIRVRRNPVPDGSEPLDGSLSVAHVWHGVAFQGYQIGARSFQALPCGAIGVAEDVGWGVQLTDGSTDSPPSLQHSLDEAAASKLSAGYSGKAEASGRWARRRALSTP